MHTEGIAMVQNITRPLGIPIQHSSIPFQTSVQGQTSNMNLPLGQSFDQAKNDDLFFLPPEAFDNPDFKRGLVMFLSPDGKSARMFITHESDPATVAGIGRVDAERKAAQEALKMSSLSKPRSTWAASRQRTRTCRRAPGTT
ncbi:MAG: hypothetical protein NVSMB60_09990 [Mycobacterium sp.]